MSGRGSLLHARRIKPWEPLVWLLAFAVPAVFPQEALIVNEIAIVALFAVSLDLVLGYSGEPYLRLERRSVVLPGAPRHLIDSPRAVTAVGARSRRWHGGVDLRSDVRTCRSALPCCPPPR